MTGALIAVAILLQSAQARKTAGVPTLSPVPVQAPVPTVRPAAMRIATTIANETIIRSAALRLLRDQTPKVLAKDPTMQTLEQRWPGIINEFLQILEPIVIEGTLRRLPAYQLQVAALFDRRMTAAELDATAAFYASPAGQHTLTLAIQGLDYRSILQQQIASGGKTKVAAGDIGSMARAAAVPAITQLDPADLKVLMAFGTSPAGAAIVRVQPELEQLAARENNASDPATEAQIEKAMSALIDRRIRAEPKK